MATKKLKNGMILTGEDAEALEQAAAEIEKQAAIQADREQIWGKDMKIAMSRLCAKFSTLAGAPGTDPWDPVRLLQWILTNGAATSGNTHAVKFVLQVWNPSIDWAALARAPKAEEGLGLERAEFAPFNVVNALGTWDDAHTRAFLAWRTRRFGPEHAGDWPPAPPETSSRAPPSNHRKGDLHALHGVTLGACRRVIRRSTSCPMQSTSSPVSCASQTTRPSWLSPCTTTLRGYVRSSAPRPYPTGPKRSHSHWMTLTGGPVRDRLT